MGMESENGRTLGRRLSIHKCRICGECVMAWPDEITHFGLTFQIVIIRAPQAGGAKCWPPRSTDRKCVEC